MFNKHSLKSSCMCFICINPIQGLITLAFLLEKLSQPQFCKGLTRKTTFFERWPWFKLNNLGIALVMASEFYTIGEKLVGGTFLRSKLRRIWTSPSKLNLNIAKQISTISFWIPSIIYHYINLSLFASTIT